MEKIRAFFRKEWKFLSALLALLVFRSIVLDWYHVPSESMVPTLLVGDRIVVSKSQYRLRFPFTSVTLAKLGDPAPGDVIVFEYPLDPSKTYVKRIVGVPGDRVSIRDGQVYVNNEPRNWTAVRGPTMPDGELTVPSGKYFVMGDNRMNSMDSRVWGFVDEGAILGKVHRVALNIDMGFSPPRFESKSGRAGIKVE